MVGSGGLNLATFGQCVKRAKDCRGRGSFYIIGAASPLFTALQVFSNGKKRSTTRVIIDIAVFDQTAPHIAHAVMIQFNPETTACQ